MDTTEWPAKLPPEFTAALQEFNSGAYFTCHETLEALWIPEKRPVRELYQGVLQIAVGCYHLTVRANWVGAVNKLEAGARRLERILSTLPLPTPAADEPNGETDNNAFASLYGVDWNGLIVASDRLQSHLRALGRDQVTEFDRSLLPIIRINCELIPASQRNSGQCACNGDCS